MLKHFVQLVIVAVGYVSLAVTLFVTNFEVHVSGSPVRSAEELFQTPFDNLPPNRMVCAAWDAVMRNPRPTKTPNVVAIAGRPLSVYDAFINAKGIFSYVFSFGFWIIFLIVALVVLVTISLFQAIANGDLGAMAKAIVLFVLSLLAFAIAAILLVLKSYSNLHFTPVPGWYGGLLCGDGHFHTHLGAHRGLHPVFPRTIIRSCNGRGLARI